MEKQLMIYKLGHDPMDELHTHCPSGCKVILSSRNPRFSCYDELNQYLSEFTKIIDLDYSLVVDLMNDITHVGLCHYRTLFSDRLDFNNYKELFYHSYEYLTQKLEEGHECIVSDYHADKQLRYAIPRWSGSRTLDIIREWLDLTDQNYAYDFECFLDGDKYNNKTLCVIPISDMISIVGKLKPFSYFALSKRAQLSELYPRSVGYDCECYMGFLLYLIENKYLSSFQSKRVTIENGEFRFC